MECLGIFLLLVFFALVPLTLMAFFRVQRLEREFQRLEGALKRQKRALARLQKALRAGGAWEELFGEEEEEKEPLEEKGRAEASETPPPPPVVEEAPISKGQEEKEQPLSPEPIALPSGPDEGPSPTGPERKVSGRRRPRPPKPAFRLDEALGPKLALWVGAVALAFAAAFLVHYSWKKGWFTPTLRVLSGLAMGLLLVGLGLRLRRKMEKIAAALTAAGLADIYICLWAAASVWNLIPAGLGFACLALTTAGAIALSLLQGQIVLAIGLIGGYATPLLVPSLHPRPGILFPYLFLLSLGILPVTLRRRWALPALAALLLGQAWAGAWIRLNFQTAHTPWIGAFLLLSSLAFLLPSLSQEDPPPWGTPYGSYLGRGFGLAGGILLLGILWWASGFTTLGWIFFLLLCAPTLYLASRRGSPEIYILWAAMFLQAAALLVWEGWRSGPSPGRLTLFAIGTGLFFAAGSYLLLWRSPRPMPLAALVSASALSFFMVLYIQLHGRGFFESWGVAAAGLGVLLADAAYPIYKRRKTLPQGDYALAGLAWGAVAGFCTALPLATSGIYLTLGWALAVPLLVRLDLALEIPSLRFTSLILALFTAVRLLVNNHVLGYPLEGGSFFNWILFGYGLSALFFLDARRTFAKAGAPELSQWFLAGSVLFLFYLVTLQVRHLFHPAGLMMGPVLLSEWGTYTAGWLFLGLALYVWNRFRPDPILTLGGHVFSLLGLSTAVLAQGVFANPAWTGAPVGGLPVLNRLLLLYGAPWLLCLLLARAVPEKPGKKYALPFFRAGALLFFFLLVTMEVRQAFHGPILKEASTGQGENYAYSAAWALYGLLLLGIGIRSRSRFLRVASMGVMALTVCKVFIFDTSHLRDLYRVFSFLCLGVSLFLLAWLYQRFVFREEFSLVPRRREEKAPSSPPGA